MQLSSNSRVTCKQPLSNTQVTRMLDMRMYASGLQVQGNWQVKCYTDECGVNRNCKVTRQQKSEQLFGKT